MVELEVVPVDAEVLFVEALHRGHDGFVARGCSVLSRVAAQAKPNISAASPRVCVCP